MNSGISESLLAAMPTDDWVSSNGDGWNLAERKGYDEFYISRGNNPIAWARREPEEKGVLVTYYLLGIPMDDLVYGPDGRIVSRTVYTNDAEGAPRYAYCDLDGDGRWDRFIDHKTHRQYVAKGLQWELVSNDKATNGLRSNDPAELDAETAVSTESPAGTDLKRK